MADRKWSNNTSFIIKTVIEDTDYFMGLTNLPKNMKSPATSVSQYVRATLSGGTGIDYNPVTGVITATGDQTGQINGIVPEYTSSFQITITAGSATDSTGVKFITLSSPAIIDISEIGEPNGLDVGIAANDTWYAVYVIADSLGVNPTSGLFSLSATAPTLPLGYDLFRRVGWVRNLTAAFATYMIDGTQSRRQISYTTENSAFVLLSAGAATTYTAVSASSAMPPTSTFGMAQYSRVPNANATVNYVRPTGTTANVPSNQFRSDTGNRVFYIRPLYTDSSQSFEYRGSAGDNFSVYGYGFVDNV